MKNKILAIKYKGGECEHCGYSECLDAFDFHHKDPSQKDFAIGSGNTKGWSSIRAELNKCLLLCANCHRTLHYNLKATKYLNDEILDEIENPKPKSHPLIPVKEKKKNFCLDCNAEIKLRAKRCSTCAYQARSKIDWPSDEVLSKLVWEKPRSELSKELGVSDRAIAKRCTAKGISQPARGYWAKLRSKSI